VTLLARYLLRELLVPLFVWVAFMFLLLFVMQFLRGTDVLLGREQRLPDFGTRITLRVGRPFHLVIPKGADRRAALAAADTELMRRIAALVDMRHPGAWEPWPQG